MTQWRTHFWDHRLEVLGNDPCKLPGCDVYSNGLRLVCSWRGLESKHPTYVIRVLRSKTNLEELKPHVWPMPTSRHREHDEPLYPLPTWSSVRTKESTDYFIPEDIGVIPLLCIYWHALENEPGSSEWNELWSSEWNEPWSSECKRAKKLGVKRAMELGVKRANHVDASRKAHQWHDPRPCLAVL
jgi:hypothetical protein